jgi:hypothetical protein
MLGNYGWMPECLSILSLMILSQSSLFYPPELLDFSRHTVAIIGLTQAWMPMLSSNLA